ncbi:hypothetical protein LCGC14_2475640 [marine sediment metagenome]|uniref:Uncharacterized protein n=1 Tax=marine sediment metagenome TaxID=412755 RepID=A0A0F9E2W0_9ZZZZ
MAIGGNPQVEEINARGIEPVKIPDPGDAGTVEVSHPGFCELTTAGAETRTLPDPAFRGQIIDFTFIVDVSDCVITASSPINQSANTQMTFADIGDHLRLIGFWNATDGWEWRVVANDGVSLA